MKELPYRQIHLDFHTSPYIEDVGKDFDAEDFVKTLKEAEIDSINIFAKCHHGMSYYPTKIGKMHPALKFDLLGEMLKVLNREDIKAPIYFPVGWEESSADNANWLEVNKNGVLGGISTFESKNYKWRKLCLNKKDYIDFILAQTQEIIDNYRVDGMWYDIILQNNCVCNDCIISMKKMGFNPQEDEDVKKHDFIVLKNFMKTVFEYVKSRLPDATVFFNNSWGPEGGYLKEYNIMKKTKYLTHMEIESLPSEYWGYNHFPLFVNYHNKHNGEVIGMNGKFHTAWGDFGSLRNLEALEYECFRMIMNGSKCCIGDQLHPRGKLDNTSYKRIGKVYKQVKDREPWCKSTSKIVEIGVLVSNKELEVDYASDEGVMRMLLELHHSFDFIDSKDDFSKYRLIVLPDNVVCNNKLSEKLSNYLNNSGKIIASYHSGLNEEMREFSLKALGVSYKGQNPYSPSFMIIQETFSKDIEKMEYVQYERGALVEAKEDAETIIELGKPYFNRTYDRFCSHQHFPFDQKMGAPAVVKKGNTIYISNPLFKDYIQWGVRVYRDVFARCIELLIEDPIILSDLPSSAEITLRKQGDRTILHILHYIAERKSKKMDIVDTKLPLYNCNISIKADKKPNKVYIAPSIEEIPFNYKEGYISIVIPEIIGHAMVVIE
jgi:hypothetical protein